MTAAPYWSDGAVALWHGDCLDVLAGMPDASVDAVVTDPPYGLEFMGREWDSFRIDDPGTARHHGARAGDHGAIAAETLSPDAAPPTMLAFQAWCAMWAGECLRVLKPGGHLLAFGGTRTWHRLACAVEDAGFEVRDSIAWLYGSGFPKSLDVSKAIDKAAGATREVAGFGPDHAKRTAAASGTISREGGAAPLGQIITAPATPAAQQWQGWGTALKPAFEPIVVARKLPAGTVAGNVLAHGTGAMNIDGCRTAHAGAADLATSQGKNPGRPDVVTSDVYGAGRPQQSVNPAGRWPTNVVLDGDAADELNRQTPDDGGASRFFPTFRYEAKAPTVERPRVDGEAHNTVKPLHLMRWLVRLVCPPGGVVLDPFAGTGTTAEACIIEGARCLTIEREAAYLPLIIARLSKPIQPDLYGLDT